jgi:hypothetical protein
MADGFDIIDLVYSAVMDANTGLTVWKDHSVRGEKNDHITINLTGVETKAYVNKAPAVNVNVYVRRNGNGMVNRGLLKSICRSVEASLNRMAAPNGMYWKSRIVWTASMGEAKEGFECVNIRIEVITELN